MDGGQRMELMVWNDGQAYQPAGERVGSGLFNLREYARVHGGTFEVATRHGHGTTARLSIPIGSLTDRPDDYTGIP